MECAVRIVRHGSVTEFVLDRPDAGNAFDSGLVEELLTGLDRVDAETCRTIVFRGEGKGFCGGFDLGDLENETDASLLLRFIRVETLLQRVASLPQTTVALGHRFAFGAGADLFVACRRRIAAPGTKFAFPGVRFGIALGTRRLARCVGADRAHAMLSATAPISFEAALESGLVQEASEQQDFDQIVRQLSESESSLDPAMARTIAGILDPSTAHSDMAALVESASRPGLKARIAAYAATVRAARRR